MGVVEIAKHFMDLYVDLTNEMSSMVSSEDNKEIVKRQIHIESLQS